MAAQAPIMTEQLSQLAAKAGRRHRYKGIPDSGSEPSSNPIPIIEGRFNLEQQRPGMQLHTFNGKEMTNGKSSMELKANLSFSLLLAGRLEFFIDGQRQQIDAGTCCQSFAFNLLQPTLFERITQKGQQIHKVNVSVSHDWLLSHWMPSQDNDPLLQTFLQTHLATVNTAATAKLQQLGHELLSAPSFNPVLQSLYTESKAIEFIAESLQGVSSQNVKPIDDSFSSTPLSQQSYHSNNQANKLKRFIDGELLSLNNQNRDLSLNAIADHVGMSVSNMQRYFKRAMGQTIIHYIRQRRLELAHEAIELRGVTIGEAAFIAGYKHPSNFSIAFKRHFGVAPGTIVT